MDDEAGRRCALIRLLSARRQQLRKKILEKSKDGTLHRSAGDIGAKALAAPEPRKRGRWDQTVDEQFLPSKKAAAATPSSWADVEVSVSAGVLYILYFGILSYIIQYYILVIL